MSLVNDPKNIKLAMLGMVPGNGHPFSWSAIINGTYDKQVMADCGYPVIPEYLGAQNPDALGIDGAKVTHVWCDDPEDSQKVAAAAHIPNVLEKPQDAIGNVDAVIIATDIGSEHVQRVKPFVDAGIPAFIDKPLTDNEEDLKQFIAWRNEGKAILSTSALRYAREFVAVCERLDEIGQVRLITHTTPKSWERYGIHALEGVYPLLPPGGCISAANTGDRDANIVHLRHQCGAEVVLSAISDMYGGFGYLNVHGTKGTLTAHFTDTFHAFKTQLVQFVEYLKTGADPVNFSETIELMKIIIAGIKSRQENGRTVKLEEICAEAI